MSRDPQINVRLPQDLKEAVQKMAEDNKRSVNAEIVALLLAAVKRHNLGDGIDNLKDLYLPSEIMRHRAYDKDFEPIEFLEEQTRLIQEQRRLLEQSQRQVSEMVRALEAQIESMRINKKPT